MFVFAADSLSVWGAPPQVSLACESNHKLLDVWPSAVYSRPMTRASRESNPTEERLRELLFGRKIVTAQEVTGTLENGYAEGQLVLDDGTVLFVGGNEGCGGCPSGSYWLGALNTADNAITNVRVEEECLGGADYTYSIFVFAGDQRINVATFDGSDGNGFYGTGYWISVAPSQLGPQK